MLDAQHHLRGFAGSAIEQLQVEKIDHLKKNRHDLEQTINQSQSSTQQLLQAALKEALEPKVQV